MITAAVMLIHVCCLYFNGTVYGIAEALCGLSLLPLIIAYAFSKGFGFCKMHRMFIDYTFKMYLCMQWHEWIGFGWTLPYFQLLMILLGVYTFGYFFIHIKEFVNFKTFKL